MAGSDVEIGSLLRKAREERGMTQQALADAIGCSKAQLSLMESGSRKISPARAHRIEAALDLHDRPISAALRWKQVPAEVRAQVQQSQTRSQVLATRIRHALAAHDPVTELRALVDEGSSNIDDPLPLRGLRGIPVINKVAAGYPTEFTDLDYPATVADEYISCPDVTDPDAFAARVVGDSMEPDYREGDLVVFAPLLPTPSGSDCFVRFERDHHTTFKRIYIEEDGRTIRLQPLNNSYPPQFVDREAIAGMYAATYVMRRVKSDHGEPRGGKASP